ncbi:hypothetical protein [Pendulispora albinea]|uniref:Ribbon-helix-helix protein CopG domain-containing protein n=1 Tax=Pendulispora albinea TaxID=2741071 RepID=A0ABZ2LWZ8_9BACT
MGRPSSPNAVQVSIRVPPEWLDRADVVAEQMSAPGQKMTRVDVIRRAFEQGLARLEREVESE